MKRRTTLPVLTLCIVGAILYFLYNHAALKVPGEGANTSAPANPDAERPKYKEPDFNAPTLPPLPPLTVDSHPVRQLIDRATADFDQVVSRQSKTLAQAVTEYQRRYGLPPPPNFDKWFQFAQARDVVLIDEYDSILDSLKPFWALPPTVIRARAREALGFDNFLIGMLIRDGKVTSPVNGWQEESTAKMLANFVQWLPDMDLAFNTHDEPRVVVPQDDLGRLVQTASDKLADFGKAKGSVRNAWSATPADLDYKLRAPESRTTRFNRFAHQATWTHSRISCPPASPARSLAESPADDTEAFLFSELMLIQNKTAFSDICNSPSLSKSFGFFDRPNSFDIVQDLFPIFSQSKISSFQDILYPSPWYWTDKVPYDPKQDVAWEKKADSLYWRGSTTGGFSRDGGWRRQHRQQVVRNVNANNAVRIFEAVEPTAASEEASSSSKSSRWHLTEAPRKDFRELFDVHFSHVGQCDPGDCKAQEDYFGLEPQAAQEAAWSYKYLLDVDGNAFSGRFYAFLRSASAVFKMAIFREWHDGVGSSSGGSSGGSGGTGDVSWLQPWVHYVPLTLSGHEYVELLRYFDREPEGRALVRQLADAGRAWAARALRNDDLEVWFFRLLLEYGRLVDDDRDNIGFVMPTV